MKTRVLFKKSITFLVGVVLIIIISIGFTRCKKDSSVTPGTIQLKATSQSMGLKSATVVSLAGTFKTIYLLSPISGLKSATIVSSAGTLILQTAMVEIGNLRIEENSGNDVQNNDQYGNDGAGGIESSTKSESGDAGDLQLAGPYLLDILNGSASIDKVTVPPGTYKKVNFDFVAGSENKGHSIALSGNFVNAQGVSIPFTLTSEIAEMIQLPLTGNGIQVTSGNIVPVSILFDISNWLNKLDFNTATQNKGQITISNVENQGLYQAFMTQVMKNIEAKE